MDINKLKNLIKLKKMNQRELADLTGYSATTINHALQRGDFKVSMLERLAKVLDVPVSYFFESGDKIEIRDSDVHVSGSIGANNTHGENQTLMFENEVLKEKINGMRKEIEYLKQMLEMIKNINK